MPHLVIYYTPNLDAETNMTALCRTLADTMLTVHDESGQQVFPTGGTRAHFQTLFDKRHIGITLQVDEGPEVFDAKHSNIHPLFAPKTVPPQV